MIKETVIVVYKKEKALLLIACFELLGIAFDDERHAVADIEGLHEYYKLTAYVKDASQAYELGKMHALKMVRAELKILDE